MYLGEAVTVRRYAVENGSEDFNDVYLCDECAEDRGADPDDGGITGEYDGYPLYWIADSAEDGYTKCEECERYHGDEGEE